MIVHVVLIKLVAVEEAEQCRREGESVPRSHREGLPRSFTKVCLISPGTDLPGEWALLALGSVSGLLRQILGLVGGLIGLS